MTTRVKLTYFGGPNGVSKGEYDSEHEAYWKILDEVGAMIAKKTLPGVDGADEYHVLVRTEPESVEYLFVKSERPPTFPPPLSLGLPAGRRMRWNNATTRVKLTYFKGWDGAYPGGKYYGEGHYESQYKSLHYWKILDEVETMVREGRLPGLVDGAHGFHVLMTTEPESVPCLIVMAPEVSLQRSPRQDIPRESILSDQVAERCGTEPLQGAVARWLSLPDFERAAVLRRLLEVPSTGGELDGFDAALVLLTAAGALARVDQDRRRRIALTYFAGGEGTYLHAEGGGHYLSRTEAGAPWEMIDEVEKMRKEGRLPHLSPASHASCHILVTEPHGGTHLLVAPPDKHVPEEQMKFGAVADHEDFDSPGARWATQRLRQLGEWFPTGALDPGRPLGFAVDHLRFGRPGRPVEVVATMVSKIDADNIDQEIACAQLVLHTAAIMDAAEWSKS